jgi:glycosyltransferase involved in cell wall biosynthesis
VPAFNAEAYIGDAIASIRAQGVDATEIIVVDDGSSDRTCAIVASMDPPVRLLRQENRGPAAARNAGLRAARGEYVAFLDADDMWLPGKLRAQLDHLAAHPDLRFVFGAISYWHPDADGIHRGAPPEEASTQCDGVDARTSGWIYPELLLDSAVCIITVLMHRSVYESIGDFDERLRTGEDYEYWLRVSRHYPMEKLARITARYRLHATGSTRQLRDEPNELRVLSSAIEQFGCDGPDGRAVDRAALRRRIAALWFDHGYLHYWNGSPHVALRAFARALRFAPRPRTLAYILLAAGRAALGERRPPTRAEGTT